MAPRAANPWRHLEPQARIMPSQRRQLEFHEDDEELAERIEEEVEETGIVKGGAL